MNTGSFARQLIFLALASAGLVACNGDQGPLELSANQREELFQVVLGRYTLQAVDDMTLPATIVEEQCIVTFTDGSLELRADSTVFILYTAMENCPNWSLDVSTRRGGTFGFDRYGELKIYFTFYPLTTTASWSREHVETRVRIDTATPSLRFVRNTEGP